MLSRDYTLRAKEQFIKEQLSYNDKLINVRFIYILVLTIAAISSSIVDQTISPTPFLIIGVVAFAVNVALWFSFRQFRKNTNEFVTFLMVLQILTDVILASFVIYSQGGDQSRATILYALPLLSSAVLFNRALVFLAAFTSVIGYVVSVLLEHSSNYDGDLDVLPLIFYPISFVIISVVVYFLAKSRSSDIASDAYKEVLAMLTHQLRHPLTATLAVADTLKNEKNISKKRLLELVDMIEKINYDGFNLVNNLLEGASDDHHRHLQKINAVEFTKDIASLCTYTYKREGDLNFTDSKSQLFIKVNPQQLRTAILNVIDNAFKYSDHGEPVYVYVTGTSEDVSISVTNASPEGAAEKLTKVISALDDAERPGFESEGTGVGIAIAAKIVKDMNGNIEVSQEDGAVTVKIILKRLNV